MYNSLDVNSGSPWKTACRSDSAASDDRLLLLILVIPIIGATLVSKLAVPYVKVDGVGMGFPLIYLSLLLGFFGAGRLKVAPARLLLFCIMVSVLGVIMLLRGENISLPSLALFILLHLPYVAQIAAGKSVTAAVQRTFLNVALFIALCGLTQYALQFHVEKPYIFPIENFLPADWLATGFNMQAPIAYGSSVYRPNGIFMPEPSFFSQLLAIATVIELLGPKRLWRIALYVIAIFASHSGTGLILLAVCVPVLILVNGRWNLVIGAAVILALLLLAGPYFHMDQFTARIGEFGSERSSAYERFIGGFYIFDASIGTDPLRMLFGYGAGSYRDIVHALNRPAAEMALFKIVVEYGLVGTLLYFGFMFFCIFSARGSFVLRLALAVCLFLNGAYNTFVHSLALALLVWPSPLMSPRKVAEASREDKAAPFNPTVSTAAARSVC